MENRVAIKYSLYVILMSLVTFSSSALSEGGGEVWLFYPNESNEDYREKEWIEQGEARICEVAKSRVELALTALNEKSFVSIQSRRELESFLGASVSCAENVSNDYQPYLLRAVYSKTNGGFRVGISEDDAIFVVYEQLGTVSTVYQTALVVFLKNEPSNLYVTIHSVM